MNSISSLLLVLGFSTLPIFAQDASAPEKAGAVPAPEAKPKKELPDFIRYSTDDKEAKLETAIKSYKNADGVIVDLVGVVHIADLEYYKKLNELLATYDAVLYELVGDPEALKDPKAKNDTSNPLRMAQKMVGNMLKLSFQLDQIDYSKSNFVHADLSAAEFSKLQGEKGENLMSLLARAMKMEREGKVPANLEESDIDMTQLLGLLSGSDSGADSLKILMAKVFGEAESMLESFEGADGTVLLTGRNKVVNEKLTEAIKGGKKHLAIFYGAGHLPGLEALLKHDQFTQQKEEWLAAWTMKAAPKKVKKDETAAPEKE